MTEGTQWSEYYWKDQTVMLLMLEPDFPDGKNPDFCAKLFREEPGVWKLKMEQFKRFVRIYKGKAINLQPFYHSDGWRKGRTTPYQNIMARERTVEFVEFFSLTPRVI